MSKLLNNFIRIEYVPLANLQKEIIKILFRDEVFKDADFTPTNEEILDKVRELSDFYNTAPDTKDLEPAEGEETVDDKHKNSHWALMNCS